MSVFFKHCPRMKPTLLAAYRIPQVGIPFLVSISFCLAYLPFIPEKRTCAPSCTCTCTHISTVYAPLNNPDGRSLGCLWDEIFDHAGPLLYSMRAILSETKTNLLAGLLQECSILYPIYSFTARQIQVKYSFGKFHKGKYRKRQVNLTKNTN